MAREDQHRQRAQRNEQFAESLDCTQAIHENWAIVATFYSALHYVEAYFSRYSVQARNHDERFEQIKCDSKLLPMLSSYKYLYVLSRTARYHCEGIKDQAYSKEAKPRLDAIKKQISHALK